MHKIGYLMLFIISFMLSVNVYALDLDINSKEVILYNSNDNKVLYEKQAFEKVPVASLTKIMTAIITLENVSNLNDNVTIENSDFKYVYSEGLATAKFNVGDTVTYLDLLYGLLLPSGADAANALGRLLGGEEEFIKLMNAKVEQLNLKNTHFSSLIGFDDDENYSTASDMAIIFSYALKNKVFKKIITTDSYTTSNGKLTFKNKIRHNENVGVYLLGGKTGTTGDAGLCLASIAEYKNINFMLITLGAAQENNNNYKDAKTIYEYFMNNYSYQVIASKKDVILRLKTKYLKADEILFYPDKDIKLYLPNDFDKEKITYRYKGIKVVDTKVKKGTVLGNLDIYYDNEKMASQKIILKEKQHFSVIKYLMDHKVIVILVILFGLFVLWRFRYGKK